MTEYRFHWWPTGTNLTQCPSITLHAESHLHGAALALRYFMKQGCEVAAPLAHLDIAEAGGARQTLLVDEVVEWLSDPDQSAFIEHEGLADLLRLLKTESVADR